MSSAAVDRMECYMDYLVDVFEDFLKQSLMMISLAIGAALLLLMYVMKITFGQPRCQRSPVRCAALVPSSCESSRTSLCSQKIRPCKKEPSFSNCRAAVIMKPQKMIDVPVQLSAAPSENETFLKEIGYSNCSKSCNTTRRMPKPCVSRPTSKTTVPSLPACMLRQFQEKGHKCTELKKRTSCCSLCCDEDQR